MNPATFPSLPQVRTDVRNQLDELFSNRIAGRFPVRQINVRWWRGFDVPLPVGTHVLIREELSKDYQVAYHLIATEDSFRCVIYVFQLDETGPKYDMTREQYFEQIRQSPNLEENL
jgi:hypothetical protein